MAQLRYCQDCRTKIGAGIEIMAPVATTKCDCCKHPFTLTRPVLPWSPQGCTFSLHIGADLEKAVRAGAAD